MLRKLLPGGVKRIIHVPVKNIRAAVEHGDDVPLTAVRLYAAPEKFRLYDRVRILGRAVLEPGPAIPGTDGRGICYIVTSAPLEVFRKARRDRKRALVRTGRTQSAVPNESQPPRAEGEVPVVQH